MRGREGGSLLAGTMLLLVVGGLPEGFVSPSQLPNPAKLLFGAGMALLLALYLLRAGRAEAARRQAASGGGGGGEEPERDGRLEAAAAAVTER